MKLKKADPAKIKVQADKPGTLEQLGDAIAIAAMRLGRSIKGQSIKPVNTKWSTTYDPVVDDYQERKYAPTLEQAAALDQWRDRSTAQGAAKSQVLDDGVYYSMPSLSGKPGLLKVGFGAPPVEELRDTFYGTPTGLVQATPALWRQRMVAQAVAERELQLELGRR